jgi:diguanylate cyclase (GGDEF)-like protein
MRVLVADDDEGTLDMLSAVLCEQGYDIVVARSGTDAWRELQREDGPSLAVLDYEMPGLDGVEVCRKVRLAGRSDIYILMLTGKSEVGDVVLGMDAGANDYLRKPADIEELCARMRAGERMLRHHQELRVKATRDHLTGVLNRGTILQLLEKELAHSYEVDEPTSVILLDVDAFKLINDTYGHMIGDAVLRELVRRLQVSLRSYDAIGRYGGEEFLIILPGCQKSNALLAAERLRHAIAAAPVETTATRLNVTISLGIATTSSYGPPSLEKIITAADRALYRAKAAGRNRSDGLDEATDVV